MEITLSCVLFSLGREAVLKANDLTKNIIITNIICLALNS